MLTELFTHAWPRRWAAYAELEKKERAAYEDAILKQVDGLHKLAAVSTAEAAEAGAEATQEERERSAQLTAQTAPVTERKHFYRTEIYQVQDRLLAGGLRCVRGEREQRVSSRCGVGRDADDGGALRHADQGQLRRQVVALVRPASATGAT